ncbi:MAG: arginase [Betaproteobacteria bacterium]|nr:arginase [Betaproteobacteria bacterium]
MPRIIDLIGVASGLGGADGNCAQGPARLAAGGLDAHLRRSGGHAAWAETLVPQRLGGGVRRAVAQLCARLAAQVAESIRGGRLPCVIGGDHSCAAGTWMGAARALECHRRREDSSRLGGRLGLVWIDAHMDAHTPGTSPSGRLHGMPLAALLGQCDHALEGLEDGALAGRHICLVGVRSFEPEEAALLARLGVTAFGMQDIVRRGLKRVLEEARSIAGAGTAGYGVTLDLDALDPADAPAVATPAPHGIRGDELVQALEPIGRDPRLAAFELAEYCPRRDRSRRTERLILRILSAALCGSAEHPKVVADALKAA